MLAFARFSADGSRALVCARQLLARRAAPLARAAASGGRWREVLNTDAAEYGGSGVGNGGGVDAVGAAQRAAVLRGGDAATARDRVARPGR